MLLEAATITIGVLLGFGFGGTIRNIDLVQIRAWPMLPVALGLQVAPMPTLPSVPSLPFIALLLSFAVIGVACIINWRLRGFRLILLGVLLNLIPIGLNQGMPVSAAAVGDAGLSVSRVPTDRGGKHHLAQVGDRVQFLGDVIPVRPPFRTVVSAGDLVMWVGAAAFVSLALLGRATRAELADGY